MTNKRYRRPGVLPHSGSFLKIIVASVVIAAFLSVMVALDSFMFRVPAAWATELMTEDAVNSLFDSKPTRIQLFPLGASQVQKSYQEAISSANLSKDQMETFSRALRAVEKTYGDMTHDLRIGWSDINHDGVLDVFVMNANSLVCGSDGCGFSLLVSQGRGDWKPMCSLQLASPPVVLPSKQHGYSDLITAHWNKEVFCGENVIRRFDGADYSAAYVRRYASYGGIDVISTWVFPYPDDDLNYHLVGCKRLLDIR